MPDMFRKILSVLTVVCLLTVYLPINGYVEIATAVGEGIENARPGAAADYNFDWVLGAVTDRPEQAENGWRYVPLDDVSYAVITGYEGLQSGTVTVPDRIAGLDVVGIADHALANHLEIGKIRLPGNLYAIGAHSFDRGTTLAGYNGSYAQRYAIRNGYPFEGLGKYDYRENVVDFADIRQDRFIRYSEKELDIGVLEASRLRTGSVFMLIDPDNAYQISYYRVVSMGQSEKPGFVNVSCETPGIEQVFRKVSGHNEIMALDTETFVPEDGIVLISRGNENKGFSFGGTTIKWDPLTNEIKTSVSVKRDIGDGELSISGEETITVTGDYSGGMYEASTGKIKTTITGSVEVAYELEKKTMSAVEGGMRSYSLDANNETVTQSRASLKNYQNALKETFHSHSKLRTTSLKYPLKMGTGVMFTFGGIFSATVQVGFLVKLSGAGKVTIDGTYVAYMGGSSDGTLSQDRGDGDVQVTAEGSISARAGIELEAVLYVGPAGVASGNIFAGIEGEAKVSISSDQLMELADGLTSETIAAYKTSPNMMDCIELTVKVLVEITAKAGLIKVIGVDIGNALSMGHTWKAFEKPIIGMHFHMMVYEISPEGHVDFSKRKDQVHTAENCPYGKASAVFKLDPDSTVESNIYEEYTPLDENQYIPEPEKPTFTDSIRNFEGWYTSDTLDEASRVSEWPHQIQATENVFYAKIRRSGLVTVIGSNGKNVAESFRCTGGSTFNLPEITNLVRWVRVDPDNDYLVLEELKADQNGRYKMNEDGEDITVMAVVSDDVCVNYVEQFDDTAVPLGHRYAQRFSEIQEPAFEYKPQFYWFGWFVNGEEITKFPWTVPDAALDNLTLSLVWMTEEEYERTHPSDEKTTYTPSGHGSTLSTFYYSYDDNNGTASVTGFNGYRERQVWDASKNDYVTEVYYVDPVHLSIPSQTSRTVKDKDGNDVVKYYTVNGIVSSALKGLRSHDTKEYTLCSVSVPGSVKTIGANAFANNPKLGKISGMSGVDTIPSSFAENCPSLVEISLSGFTSIGSYAFKGCTSLYKVSLGGDVGNYAFAGCTSLHEVQLQDTHSIGNSAFEGDTDLVSIKLSSHLERVGSSAFKNCSRLKELKFPSTVVSYGSSMISGCEALHFLTADGSGVESASSSAFTIGQNNGLREIHIGDAVRKIPESAFSNGDNGFLKVMTLKLPVSLTTIEKKAFYKCGMVTLTLPLSISKIGERAFAGCSHLTKLNIDGNNLELGVEFMADCPRVKEIHILPGVSSIAAKAFSNTTAKLVTVTGMKVIPDSSFYGSKIEKIVLDEGVERIESWAFSYSKRLKELVCPGTITDYGIRIIEGCSALEELTVGGSGLAEDERECDSFRIDYGSVLKKITILEGTERIGNNKFSEGQYSEFKNLETVVFPESLKEIGESAFNGSGIISLHIPSTISKLGERAFYNNRRMTDLTVDGNNLTIPTDCFRNASALKSVHIGGGVKSIGEYALYNTGAEKIVLDEGVERIESWAFSYSKRLKELVCPGTITDYGIRIIDGCSALEELTVGGSGLAKDERECDSFRIDKESVLKKITILEGTERIGDYKFCEGIYSEFKNLETVVFPESLKEIGESAFNGSGIISLHIPSTISKLGERAFYNNRRMTDLTVDGNNLTIPTDCFRNASALKSVHIGGGVKSIGEYALYNTGAEKIVLDEGVERIESWAFSYSKRLKELVCPGTITDYGSSIIEGCSALEELTVGGSGLAEDERECDSFRISKGSVLKKITILEGTERIGDYKFCEGQYSEFKNLETVVFPESLKEIGKSAFNGSGIISLHIPSMISKLGERAFYNNRRMNDLTVDGNNLTIPTDCFRNASALKSVHIGGGVKSIGNSALYNTGAEKIVLDEGVERIESSAFSSSIRLKELVCPGTITDYGSSIIEGCSALEELTVGGSGLAEDERECDSFVIGKGSVLKKITILEGTERIGNNKFSEGQYSEFKNLETVVFPESLKEIGAYGLRGASKLKSIRIPNSCTGIDQNAFYRCSNLLMYTDAYNEYVEQYVNNHKSQGFLYEIMDPENYPYMNMTYVYPDGEEVVRPVQFRSLIHPIDAKEISGEVFENWYWDSEFAKPLLASDRMQLAEGRLYARYVSQLQAVYAVKVPVGRTLESKGDEALYNLPEKWVTWAILPHTLYEKVRSPETLPMLDGWNFTGWYTDPEMTHLYSGGQMPENGLILYGGFKAAALGGSYNWGEYGYTLTNYHMTEQDGDSIVLPNMVDGHVVEAIGLNVFAYSGKAKSITVPSGVSYVHPEAFGMLPNLERIEVDGQNSVFTSRDGILYSKDLSILYRCPMNRLGGNVTIPSAVKTIAPYAFAYCKNIKTVVFPEGLESIGTKAFVGCTSLTGAALPKSTTYVGDHAFTNCTSMRSFSAPALGYVGEYALPNNVFMSIRGPVGEGVLREYCMRPENGMSRNYNIRYATVLQDGETISVLGIEAGTTLPAETVISEADSTYVRRLYQDSNGETVWPVEAVMPNEDISLFALLEPVFTTEPCTINVENNTVSGVRITGYNGFGGDVRLTAMLYGERLLAVGDYAFAGTQLPITSLTLPESILAMDDHALDALDGTRFNGTLLTDEGTYVYRWAEANGYVPTKPVYDLVFDTKGGALISRKQMTAGGEIRLPEPVRTGYQFEGWYLDDSETEPVTLTENGFFRMPTHPVTLYGRWLLTDGSPYQFEEHDGAVHIVGYEGTETVVTVPETLNGLPVTGIEARAFAGLKGVTRIVLPDNVTEIGQYAFRDCEDLQTIRLGVNVQKVGKGLFYGTSSLTGIEVVPGNAAFSTVNGMLLSADQQMLIAVPANVQLSEFPSGVHEIAAFAMAGNKKTTKITLPSSVQTIGLKSFAEMPNLTELDFSSAICEIPQYLASGCTALRKVTIGEGVSAIGAFAFESAKGLEELHISGNVQTIAKNMLSNAGHKVVIVGKTQSEAYRFARMMNIPFVDPDAPELEKLTIVTDKDIISIGEWLNLSVTSEPDMEVTDLSWSSSKESVAIVENGKVHGLARGVTQIRVEAPNGVSDSIEVSVKGVPAQEITILNAPERLAVGDMFKLNASIQPVEAEDESPIWTAGPALQAESDGTITGIQPGESWVEAATISEQRDRQTLQVYNAVTVITVPEDQREINLLLVPGKNAMTLSLAAEPDEATVKELTYASSDEKTVTVDENGVIQAKKLGEARITVTTDWTHQCEPLSVEIPVHVLPADIQTVTLTAGPLWGSDTNPVPELKLMDDTYELVRDQDYSVVVSDEHGATVKGIGMYSGERQVMYQNYNKPRGTVSCESMVLSVGQSVSPVTDVVFDEKVPEEIRSLCTKNLVSSNPEVVDVDETGMVRALTPGSAVVSLNTSIPLEEAVQIQVTVESDWKTMTLPAALKYIDEKAFLGTSPNRIVIGDQVETIKADAFEGMSSLRQIEVRSEKIETEDLGRMGSADVLLLIPEDATVLRNQLETINASYVLTE